uniref:Uncharacterized protein n=1 Tax=Ditylenchus dipsaci TaxID=166011 RepID=A0A915E044_9BILA
MDLTLDGENTAFENKVITPNRNVTSHEKITFIDMGIIPGPPFLFGAVLVLIALLLNMSLPANKKIFRRHGYSTSSSKHLDTAMLIDEKD